MWDREKRTEKASIYAYTSHGFLAVTDLQVNAFSVLQEPETNAGSSENVAAATFQRIQPAKCYGVPEHINDANGGAASAIL